MKQQPYARSDGRVRDADTFIAVVTYPDGPTAYMWLPKTDDRDLTVIARERQTTGEIPAGNASGSTVASLCHGNSCAAGDAS